MFIRYDLLLFHTQYYLIHLSANYTAVDTRIRTYVTHPRNIFISIFIPSANDECNFHSFLNFSEWNTKLALN